MYNTILCYRYVIIYVSLALCSSFIIIQSAEFARGLGPRGQTIVFAVVGRGGDRLVHANMLIFLYIYIYIILCMYLLILCLFLYIFTAVVKNTRRPVVEEGCARGRDRCISHYPHTSSHTGKHNIYI